MADWEFLDSDDTDAEFLDTLDAEWLGAPVDPPARKRNCLLLGVY